MQRRIIGGIAGWLIGVLPLIGVNAADYFGLYINPILALVVSLLLGSVVTGYIGGKADGQAAGGSIGAGVAGGISAVLYAVSLVFLLLLAQSLGVLGSILSGQLFHITVAILFLACLWLGIAVLTGLLTGTRQDRRERTLSAPRGQVQQPGFSSYRQEAPLRYTGTSTDGPSPRGATPSAPRREGYGGRSDGDGGFYDRYDSYDTGNAFDSRRYEPGNLGAGYPAGQRLSERDSRRS
jgi:hypothetical protein